MKRQWMPALVITLLAALISGCGGPVTRGSTITIAPYPLPLPSETLANTATPLKPPTPIPGSPVATLATLDPSKVTWVPTRTPIPGTPTPTLTPIIMPTQMPWNIVTPSASSLTYVDPTFGFSFQYPANWQLDKPAGPHPASVPEGTELSIRNYDLGLRKGPTPPDALTIEFTLSAEAEKYGTVDNWLAQQKQRDASVPSVKYSPEEHITVSNIPALRFVVTGPTVPQGNQLTVWSRGKWLYIVSALPASSSSIGMVARIISSFKIP